MQKFGLKSTEDNLRKSIIRNITGRNKNIYNFIKMLNSLNGNWTIAIDGKWGSGKTFFVKQTQLILDELRDGKSDLLNKLLHSNISNENKTTEIKEATKLKFNTLYFDAWLNDNDNDPIVSLSQSIIQSELKKKRINFKAAKKLLKLAIRIISIVSIYSNKVSFFINSLRIPSLIKQLGKDQDNLDVQFNKQLSSLIKDNDYLIIFVDELDRCRPSYAVHFLERIQHYFDNDHIIFVISVDLNELRCTINNYYGTEFNATRYLDRFFDTIISIPDVNLENYLQFISKNKSLDIFDTYIKDLAIDFKFSLREFNHFYSSAVSIDFKLKNSLQILKPKDMELVTTTYIALYLFALKITNRGAYEQIVNNENEQEILNLAKYLNNNIDFRNLFYDNNVVTESLQKKFSSELINICKLLFQKNSDSNYYKSIKVGNYTITIYKCKEMLSDIISLISNNNFYNVN